MADPIEILVDADACPVKAEIYRVATRCGVRVVMVSGGFLNIPDDPLFERVIAGEGFDAADDRIAERARPGTIVVTADVPLAARAVRAGAEAIAPNGRPFTEASIGMAVAMRDLMEDLRAAGERTGGPRPFSPRDRSAFLSALDAAIVRLRRKGFA